MNLSKRNPMFNESTISKIPKQPARDIVQKLNSDILQIQKAVKHFNKSQQNSSQMRKYLNMKRNPCLLKTLTEPKFQNILLESNFNENPLFINISNSMKRSKIGFSTGKSNLSKNVTTYSNNLTTYSNNSTTYPNNFYMRKTHSLVKQRPNKQQELKVIQENPQNQSQQFIRRNVSFKQQVATYNKFMFMSKKPQINLSQKKITDKSINFDPVLYAQQTNTSLMTQQSKSILMKSNTLNGPYRNLNLQNSIIMCKTQQKSLHTSPSFSKLKNSDDLKKRIQSKTIELEKQWLKTQNYKQKYNITQKIIQSPAKTQVFRKANKFDKIITKIMDRRPQTSYTGRNENLGQNKFSNTLRTQENAYSNFYQNL